MAPRRNQLRVAHAAARLRRFDQHLDQPRGRCRGDRWRRWPHGGRSADRLGIAHLATKLQFWRVRTRRNTAAQARIRLRRRYRPSSENFHRAQFADWRSTHIQAPRTTEAGNQVVQVRRAVLASGRPHGRRTRGLVMAMAAKALAEGRALPGLRVRPPRHARPMPRVRGCAGPKTHGRLRMPHPSSRYLCGKQRMQIKTTNICEDAVMLPSILDAGTLETGDGSAPLRV